MFTERIRTRARKVGEVERLNDMAPIGLCYLDTDFRFRYLNRWLARINGFPVEAHLGRTMGECLEDVAVGIEPQLRSVIDTGEPIMDGEVQAETPAHPGQKRFYRHSYFPDIDADGRIIGICCVIRDETAKKQVEEALAERNRQLEVANRQLEGVLGELRVEAARAARANTALKQAKKELQRLAFSDAVTGLGNRSLFEKQLGQLLSAAAKDGEEVALLEMDLDGFKGINDQLGHAAGDEVLEEFSARLMKALSRADRTYRIGGDEFAVLLAPRAGAFDHAVSVARQIAESAAAPMRIRGHTCSVGVSIGIAVFPDHGREPTALLRKADAAMYEAKKNNLVLAGASDAGATTVLTKLQMDA